MYTTLRRGETIRIANLADVDGSCADVELLIGELHTGEPPVAVDEVCIVDIEGRAVVTAARAVARAAARAAALAVAPLALPS